jgi:hypothetical protein
LTFRVATVAVAVAFAFAFDVVPVDGAIIGVAFSWLLLLASPREVTRLPGRLPAWSSGSRRVLLHPPAGAQLRSIAMQNADVFPNMVTQMVSIGEESGALDQMLGKVADFYEDEVDEAVKSLSSLMEPLIMVILGVLIGGLVVAMYLPIFKLGSVV